MIAHFASCFAWVVQRRHLKSIGTKQDGCARMQVVRGGNKREAGCRWNGFRPIRYSYGRATAKRTESNIRWLVFSSKHNFWCTSVIPFFFLSFPSYCTLSWCTDYANHDAGCVVKRTWKTPSITYEESLNKRFYFIYLYSNVFKRSGVNGCCYWP